MNNPAPKPYTHIIRVHYPSSSSQYGTPITAKISLPAPKSGKFDAMGGDA